MIKKVLPLYCCGEVIKGFGRGSKQLGIPTANYSNDVIAVLPKELQTGVYYGWAQVNSGSVYKMVMSIGWNPYYKNEKKSMETHILNDFEDDFYGSILKTCILGYIRPEKDFDSLDELISTIKADISIASDKLDCDEFSQFKLDPFFSKSELNGHMHSNVVATNGVDL